MNKRGAVLIICYMVIIVLTVLGAAFFMSSVSEGRAVNKYYDSTQAFWLAETGVNRAIYLLKNNLSLTGGSIPGVGDYNFDSVVDLGGGSHEITVRGSVPSATSSTKVERVIEFRVNKYIPPGFYDHAIYAAGNLERKGNVIGTVVYGGTPSGSYKDPQPTSETHDPSISPLALLDFEQLRTISKAQGNYHDSDHLSGP
ncbi:MAG: hypothetical protein NTY47_08850, partial [Candidatus Omnitrophica bacterium]|nr:hypothetical protein [Candidatus Omnitrophota bacterium]